MTIRRMDNIGIVVEASMPRSGSLPRWASSSKGARRSRGNWVDGVTGLRDKRVEIAMMRAPDGHGRLELSRFPAPAVLADHRIAPRR